MSEPYIELLTNSAHSAYPQIERADIPVRLWIKSTSRYCILKSFYTKADFGVLGCFLRRYFCGKVN